MAVNKELLEKVVRWVERESKKPLRERQWHQGVWLLSRRYKSQAARMKRNRWTCNTAMCLAGKVAMLEGWKPYVDKVEESWGYEADGHQVQRDGEVRSVREVASEALGIGHAWANMLFEATNSAKEIRRLADALMSDS